MHGLSEANCPALRERPVLNPCIAELARRIGLLIALLACVVLVGCSTPVRLGDTAPAPKPHTSPRRGETVSVEKPGEAPASAPGSSSEASATTGLLRVSLTDAPAPLNVEKVLVTISSVQVHRATAEGASEKGDDSGWHTVVEAPHTFELLALRDVRAFLGAAELATGKYTQIRLSVTEALATIDGTEHQLKVPSDKLKLVSPFTVGAGQTTEVTLDFDATKSIHAASKKYMMKPTIKVIVEGPAPSE